MKPIFTFCLCFLLYHCAAQKILVPYRSADLWGLCDEQQKIVVKPQFDEVSWMEDTWFSTERVVLTKDSLEVAPGRFRTRDSRKRFGGLIHDGVIVLKDEPFREFEIVAGKCIVSRFDGNSEQLTMEQYRKYGSYNTFYGMFNLQGKSLYAGSFRRIQKVDTAGSSSRNKGMGRYILFIVEHHDRSRSMLVFDADLQQISSWLVKNAQKIEADRNNLSPRRIPVTIVDKDGRQSERMLDYTSGKFVLAETAAANRYESAEETGYGTTDDGVISRYHGIGDPDAVPEPPSERHAVEKPVFDPYYKLVKDTLYYVTDHDIQQPVRPGADYQFFFTEPGSRMQRLPVIAKSGGRFYIVRDGRPGEVAYDSLIYFGANFLAWQPVNGKQAAGLVDARDSAIVPLVYDSVFADIRYFKLEHQRPGADRPYDAVLKEAASRYGSNYTYPYKREQSNLLTVYKEGHCGVIDVRGDTIVPIAYNMVARNNLQHSRPKEYDYLLLRKDNGYRIATLKRNRERKRQELHFISAASFEYIPAFFIPGYYGVQDYKLVGLYDDQMKFKGYASEDGRKFYED